MKLSLQDRVALIYTSAGSQREVARQIGISHQKVGRILRAGQEGGYKPDSPAMKDFFVNEAVNMAFSDHKKKTRAQAVAHDIPYDPTIPVFSARMAHKNGVPGDRVEAPHLHWVSDQLRNAWIRKIHPSGKYMNISVGSIVNLHDYNRLANAVNAGKFRNLDERSAKVEILAELSLSTGHQFLDKPDPDDYETDTEYREAVKEWSREESANLLKSERTIMRETKDKIVPQRIQTQYTRFDKSFPIDFIINDVSSKLNQKHGPAVGDPGTVFADRVLLQVKTSFKADEKFRKAHPFKPKGASKPGAARKGKKRAKSNR